MYRSNGFARSISGAVLEAPSEELKIAATEIPDSVPMMFVVSAKSQEALPQHLNNYRNARRILMGFPGQGSQYQGMGRYLAQQSSGFSAIITDAANKASVLTGYPVLPFLVVSQLIRVKSPRFVFSFSNTPCALGWKVSVSMLTLSWATAWVKLRQQVCSLLMSQDLFFLLLTDLTSDCPGFQFRSWFAVCGCQGYPSRLLHPDPVIAASEEKVARYTSKLDVDSRVAIAVYNGPESRNLSPQI